MVGAGHSASVKEVFKELNTSEQGLSESSAEKKLLDHGFNELIKEKGKTALSVFADQFKSIMILILFVAVIVSALLGEFIDAGFILFIIIINAVLGFVQEYRAEKALDALKKLTTPHARVIRNGKEMDILARELVPGDVIVLDEGKKIPADARIIRSSSLKVDESMLTGESTATIKVNKVLREETSLADRVNMCFMGTLITSGNGLAVVTETGMATKMGKITKMVQEAEEKQTLLQIRLNNLSKILAGIVVVLSLFTFLLGVVSGKDFVEMFLVTVSLAVSAVPEGLPAIITVTLALGVQRMAGKNAIVRKLPAVESLGSANIICTDKTGTLTKNEMTVREYYFANRDKVMVTGAGYEPAGNFLRENAEIRAEKDSLLTEALVNGVLCNNASLQKVHNKWDVLGDHTEGALLVSARKAGVTREKIGNRYKFIKEFPFTSERKRMTVIYEDDEKDEARAYTKGAPEILLRRCYYYYDGSKKRRLTGKLREDILDKADEMAGRALRVLLLAFKDVKTRVNERGAEKDLVFVSLVGMIDPPRDEVKSSIREASAAGIRTIMITGDHASTARAIAKEIGLVSGDIVVITGEKLDKMSDDELEQKIKKVNVFARVSPEHKVRILQSLMKDEDNIVAMTGDGVNDAPAIKNAHIGVSMGLRGTDVAKESSDIILLDDNYATIISAVGEGRGIYENITKFVRFLLSCNFDELLLVGFSAIMGLPLPLLALQILWLNIVTDGLPALALGVDPAPKDVMKQAPRNPKESILKRMLLYAIVGGFFAFGTGLFIFLTELGNIDKARTMVFTSAVIFELFFVFSARSQTKSMFHGFFSNKYLILAVLSSLLLHVFAVYTGIMNSVLKTVPLALNDWVKVILVCGGSVLIVDALKIMVYRITKHEHN